MPNTVCVRERDVLGLGEEATAHRKFQFNPSKLWPKKKTDCDYVVVMNMTFDTTVITLTQRSDTQLSLYSTW